MSEVVALEVAEVEFNRFAEEFDLDTNVENMSEEDAKSFKDQKAKIIRVIMSGHAVVDEVGNITYKLKKPKEDGSLVELKFVVPMGNVFTEMDNHKEHKHVHKMNNALGVMTGQPPSAFAIMNSIDVKFCQAIGALFLGS